MTLPSTRLGRKEVTARLKLAVTFYLVAKKLAVFQETGLQKRGRRRADILALSMKGNIVIVELKSCRVDYMTDKKIYEYLPRCHQLYLAITEEDWDAWGNSTIDKQFGVMVLGADGYVRVVRRCKHRVLEIDKEFYINLAWKSSTASRKHIKRTNRVYL